MLIRFKGNITLFSSVILMLLTKTFSSDAQSSQWDTIKVMTYNTLNYGFPATGSCPTLLTESKHLYLQTILQAEDPDILALEKMDATPSTFSSDTIIQKVLNVFCPGCYRHSVYTNVSGYTKENMLYFKKDKFGYINTTTIYSLDPNISDINLHKLYYKDSNLAITLDTVYLNIIVVHLKSGTTSTSDRATEVAGAMAWLNANVTAPGNYIFMGDMNTTSSNENCFQYLINSTNNNTKFYDPPNQLGDWSNNPNLFVNYLTHSTRTVDPGDCGAVGSISERFDHILCTQPIILGLDSIQYVAGSYHVIGQDGLHTGLALTDAPTNTSVSTAELNALYYMSNHLPVTMQLAIKKSSLTGIQQNNKADNFDIEFNHDVNNGLEVTINSKSAVNEKINCSIYNLQGQLLQMQDLKNNSMNEINVNKLTSGIYLLKIISVNTILLSDKFSKL